MSLADAAGLRRPAPRLAATTERLPSGDGGSSRVGTIAIWAAAATVVLAAHAACAIVLLNRPRAPARSHGEPPTAVLIDLPTTTFRARASGPAGQTAPQPVAAATEDENAAAAKNDDGHAAAGFPPSIARSTVAPFSWNATERTRKPGARKPNKPARMAEPKPAARRPPALSSTTVADSATAVSAAEIPSAWKSALLRHLERYKRYPDSARPDRREGTTLLSFTISRDGRVLDAFVARSSGFAPLDEETLAMVKRASPLPKIPADVSGESLQLVAPVHFSIQ